MVVARIFGTACFLLASFVTAHPGPHNEVDSALLAKRSLKAKRCANEIGAMKQKRRALRKRETTTYEVFAEGPTHDFTDDFLKNESLVMMPETFQGPYWYPASQPLRQDMREGERGVPLELDIGVINVNTCEPMPNVLIDLWHCNATGSYSSFTLNDPNVRVADLLAEKNISTDHTFTDLRFLATDGLTFLRGMWPTDKHGTTAFTSIFPGFYVERTIHIHVQAHTDWNVTRNGTIGSSRVVQTGQIFFDEVLSADLMSVEPYASHTEIGRFPNYIDGIYLALSDNGAMTVPDTEPLDGLDYHNGVLAYITLVRSSQTGAPAAITLQDAKNEAQAIDPTEIRDGEDAPPAGWGAPATNASGYASWSSTYYAEHPQTSFTGFPAESTSTETP